MSMSREHYQAQLEVLRRVYLEVRSIEILSSTTRSCCVEEEMHQTGVNQGFCGSADLIMLHIKDVQRALRRIYGVEKKYDRIYIGGAR
jgi:hypothetical protein